MDTDRNLLFGVVALQADLLDADQFIQACTLWTTRKEIPLADLLVELGWLTAEDKNDVERLLARKLKKHAGNIKNGLAPSGPMMRDFGRDSFRRRGSPASSSIRESCPSTSWPGVRKTASPTTPCASFAAER